MSKNKKVGAYKRGLYQAALAFIRSKQVVTRSAVEKFYTEQGKSETASKASATVLLSPRKEDSKRGKFGNCLGNFSADGTHYYMIPLKHVKGEEKKFRFHLATPEEVTAREAIDAKRGNGRTKAIKEVKQVKVAVKKPAKKPVKKVKAKAKAKVAVAVETPAPAVVETPAPAPVAEAPAVTEPTVG